MSGNKDHPTEERSTERADEREVDGSAFTKVGRRTLLKSAGVGVATYSGLRFTTTPSSAASTDGPPNPDDWVMTFEDQFEGTSLDTSNWEIGFGWGMTSTNDDADVSADDVHVENGRLRLDIEHHGDGEVTQGAINSQDLNPIEPPVFVEARMQPAGRAGILPAFWAKPNNENWPPEIDFLEVFNYDGDDDENTAHFNVHYTESGVCDDSSSHASVGSMGHSPGHKVTEQYHVYGCLWMPDYIEFYFDGQHVATVDDPSVMESVNNSGCLPYYMMFTNHVNRVGTPDYSEWWHESTLVDWVRLWDYDPDGEGGTGDDSDGTEHYFWVRADGDEPVTYAFETSGGDISVDDGELDAGEDDEWVSSDGYIAGGVEHNSGGDGFWYHGEITDFAYDAPVDTYIDDQYVDPDSLVDESNPGPEKPSDGSDDDSTDTNTAPVIDRYDVSERGSPNPHADIVVDWAVSDADGDLARVLVQVADATGAIVDAKRTTVSGDAYSDVGYFRIKKARNESFDVTLTVTDSAGASTTATARVTE